jgi:NitT/TauT family transport system permease protein
VPFLRSRAGILTIQAVIVVALLLAWEYGTGNPNERFVLLDEFYVGKPSEVWHTLADWYQTGLLLPNAWFTLKAALIGFGIGCAGGMLAGFFLGISPLANRILGPFVTAAFSVPRLALTPLFVLWFGLGLSSKVALVSLIIFFLVFFNTFGGVREVDRSLLDVLRVMGASRLEIHLKVTLPSIVTWVLAGLRISVPYAFVSAVLGEMLGGREGLGTLLQRSSATFNPSGVFAAIAIVVIMSLVLNGIVTLLDRRLLRWRVSTTDRHSGGATL